ncbi:MAG TPA: elongation factor P maturation arginine rhamnosyltransferase EarP [Casimicrobiaceae bacterium]
MAAPLPRWDIFCTVVDNYGDAGVAWRLARQLASEHSLAVRLFVDGLPALARLAPAVDATLDAQRVENVEVRKWSGRPAALRPADPGAVVIEAFGCGLPASYLASMAARERAPVWINLEYLSAEDWIEGCHGLASRHPTLPLTRYFFFPGFTPASGGLLREHDLVARRDRFRADAAARESMWRTLGLGRPGPGTLAVSLFCYPDAPLSDLLDAWAEGDAPVVCAVPQGVAGDALARWTGRTAPHIDEHLVRGRLTLAGVPFVSQDDYDRLLWACDVNFVRGEDSFVRAQWAARPVVWHVYAQSENAHRLKLDAFLARYCAGLAPELAAAVSAFCRAWNGDGNIGPAWARLAEERTALTTHAEAWAARLAAQSDLAATLVRFCADRL